MLDDRYCSPSSDDMEDNTNMSRERRVKHRLMAKGGRMMLPCSSRAGMLKIWKAVHPGLSLNKEETEYLTEDEKENKQKYEEKEK